METLQKSILSIERHLEILKNDFKGSSDEVEKLQKLMNAKTNLLAFIQDGYKKRWKHSMRLKERLNYWQKHTKPTSHQRHRLLMQAATLLERLQPPSMMNLLHEPKLLKVRCYRFHNF